VLNSQRDRIYSERRKALLSDNLDSVMVEYSEETMNDILEVRGQNFSHIRNAYYTQNCRKSIPCSRDRIVVHSDGAERYYVISTARACMTCMQANIPTDQAVEDWMLDALAAKARPKAV
jgi:hypothetical protein